MDRTHTGRAGAAALSALVALCVWSSPVKGQYERILGSSHDFTDSHEGQGTLGDACVACHGLNGSAANAIGPVANAGTRYETYRSSRAPSSAAPQPKGVSLVCLGCHDGSTGSDVHGNALLGTDLSDDHPISIVYDDRQNPSLRPARELAAQGVKLFAADGVQTVECASCHNPHDGKTARAFLRRSNEKSGLCRSCHLK